jgi:hypothetical protein
MNLVGSLHTLLHPYGSSQHILLAWLCLLALAVLVFLVLVAVGVHRVGRGRHAAGTDPQAAAWHYHQFLTGPPQSWKHVSPGRGPHERR